MKQRYRLEEKESRKPKFVKLVRRLALLALFFMALYLIFLYAGGRPELSRESLTDLSTMPLEKTYRLSFSKPVKEIEISAEQAGQKREILRTTLSQPSQEVTFTLRPKEMGLKEGEARLTVKVSSGPLLGRTFVINTLVDITPPPLRVVAYTSSPSLGGSGALKVRSEEGVQVSLTYADYRYTLYPMGQGYYGGLFPIRIDAPPQSIKVEVRDRAGNLSYQLLPLRIREVKFAEDTIRIEEPFIERVIYPLLGQEGRGLGPVEAFKRVNEVWRAKNLKRIEEIGNRSEPRVLWEGAFTQLPNSRVLAGYGDLRHYLYQGQKVSESRHMGYDFASVERAPVPASNSGVVVFAGDLGIYGNTVIIDHGMGLMSLYGHLSDISVKEGQFVKKGEQIGRTGASGLALGDHLHFGIILQGYEVNPKEWLDPKWIKNHIMQVLEAQ